MTEVRNIIDRTEHENEDRKRLAIEDKFRRRRKNFKILAKCSYAFIGF